MGVNCHVQEKPNSKLVHHLPSINKLFTSAQYTFVKKLSKIFSNIHYSETKTENILIQFKNISYNLRIHQPTRQISQLSIVVNWSLQRAQSVLLTMVPRQFWFFEDRVLTHSLCYFFPFSGVFTFLDIYTIQFYFHAFLKARALQLRNNLTSVFG